MFSLIFFKLICSLSNYTIYYFCKLHFFNVKRFVHFKYEVINRFIEIVVKIMNFGARKKTMCRGVRLKNLLIKFKLLNLITYIILTFAAK